jgi:hypothetical protein
MVALAFGSPDHSGPALADVIDRWNREVDDPDLALPSSASLCGRAGASVGDIVSIRAACTAGVVGQVEVAVARSAGRSQEILETLVAMFGPATTFDTAVTGLTFDITIRKPRLVDPDDPLSADGTSLAPASPTSVYERPGLMYGGALAMIIAIHAAALGLRSRSWQVLFAGSAVAWSAVLVADIRFLSSGRVMASLAAVTIASLAANLMALANQTRAPMTRSFVDLRRRPPEIDLTLEPPPLSPRWGARGQIRNDRETQPPRIL